MITYSDERKIELDILWKKLHYRMWFEFSGYNMTEYHNKCRMRSFFVAYKLNRRSCEMLIAKSIVCFNVLLEKLRQSLFS